MAVQLLEGVYTVWTTTARLVANDSYGVQCPCEYRLADHMSC